MTPDGLREHARRLRGIQGVLGVDLPFVVGVIDGAAAALDECAMLSERAAQAAPKVASEAAAAPAADVQEALEATREFIETAPAQAGPDDLASLRAWCEEIWDAWPSEVVLALLDRAAAVPADVQADAALIREALDWFLDGCEPDAALERMTKAALAALDRLEAALQRQDLALRFIAQEAKDGRVEVEQGVKNAPTFWLESIERRAVAALPGTAGSE